MPRRAHTRVGLRLATPIGFPNPSVANVDHERTLSPWRAQLFGVGGGEGHLTFCQGLDYLPGAISARVIFD